MNYIIFIDILIISILSYRVPLAINKSHKTEVNDEDNGECFESIFIIGRFFFQSNVYFNNEIIKYVFIQSKKNISEA